jgi:hypothetical protein
MRFASSPHPTKALYHAPVLGSTLPITKFSAASVRAMAVAQASMRGAGRIHRAKTSKKPAGSGLFGRFWITLDCYFGGDRWI